MIGNIQTEGRIRFEIRPPLFVLVLGIFGFTDILSFLLQHFKSSLRIPISSKDRAHCGRYEIYAGLSEYKALVTDNESFGKASHSSSSA